MFKEVDINFPRNYSYSKEFRETEEHSFVIIALTRTLSQLFEIG
jgi:hypothetical protein